MNQGQKSWEYSHKETSTNLVHVFSPNSKCLLDKMSLKTKLQQIQQVESNNHLQSSIINVFNESDTSWLEYAISMNFEYAVYWYDGCWAVRDSFEETLQKEIQTWNEVDDAWIVAGELIEEYKKYPTINRSFIIINLANWASNQKIPPHNEVTELRDFEAVDLGWRNSLFKIEPVEGYVDYFKKQKQKHIDEYVDEIGKFPFVSWLAWCIDNHIPVFGISDDLYEDSIYVNPFMDTEQFELGINGEPYDRDRVSRKGKYVIDKMLKPSSPVYFVNTESSSPIVVDRLLDTEFEQYIGVTAGFKLLYYAYKYGINPGFTDFVWFDFDPHSCAFKRETLKQWDGTNYPAWVDDWCERNPQANLDLQPLVIDKWYGVLNQFGGQRNFEDFWIQVSFSDHTVVECDLINNNQTLFDKIKNKRSFMWTSNIYSYILPTLMQEQSSIDDSFIDMITKLKATHKDTWFSGTDTQDNDIMCPVHDITNATNNTNLGQEQ